MTTKIQVKGQDCWITVAPFIVYVDGTAKSTGEFVSFFSFQEPGFFYGREVVGKDGIVARFSSQNEAFEAAEKVAAFSVLSKE